jgi:hypothetical protein
MSHAIYVGSGMPPGRYLMAENRQTGIKLEAPSKADWLDQAS